MDVHEMLSLASKIAETFSPSAPIDQQALFAGRIEQIIEVNNAVSQRGQHVILYGERGVGKTSLATVISRMFGGTANLLQSGTVNCDQTMDFSSLWRKVLREIPIQGQTVRSIGFQSSSSTPIQSLADYLPEKITPDDIRHLLQKIGKTIIVLDELDRITDRETTTLLADTIKNLSDHSVDTTLILVGVADSVDTLIGEHLSVERALVQIRMPRMNINELEEIIDKGSQNSNMTVDSRARKTMALLSQGLPHYTHLLALHAFQQAALSGRSHVEMEDVNAAIQKALGQAQQSIIGSYLKATSSPRANLYPQVLLACALAKCDSLGFFSAADVRAPMTEIMQKEFEIPAFSQHLNAFCDQSRGPVLQRIGEARRYRFRFVNPLMQPYVVMNGVDRNLISESMLWHDD